MKIWYNNENMVKLPKCDIHKSGGGDLDSKLSVQNYKMSSTFFRIDLIYGSFMMGSPQACGSDVDTERIMARKLGSYKDNRDNIKKTSLKMFFVIRFHKKLPNQYRMF